MSWRVIFIEETERLSLYLDNIKIYYQQEELLVPLSDIHTIILDNYKTTLSVHLVNALAKNNINVLICDINHMPESTIIPLFGNHLSPALLKRQIEWNDEIKKFVHKIIIEHKLESQLRHLECSRSSQQVINKIKDYKNGIKLGDLNNREGLAAKIYFREIFGSNFKRFEDDVINAGLNYGYAIIRSQMTKVLISKGLETSLGFFHKGPNNKFNLSDDFIEPFRPVIDSYVKSKLMDEAIFKKEHRLSIIKQTTKTMIINGNRQTIFNTMSIYVDSILKLMETGDVNKVYQPIIDFNEL